MDYLEIKSIYYNVLARSAKIKWLGLNDHYSMSKSTTYETTLSYTYKNGRFHGESHAKRSNGNFYWKYNYRNGLRHGSQKSFNEYGFILVEETYRNGVLIP